MFGRTVTIDDREVFVWCTPQTPLSEVLLKASKQLEQKERADLQKPVMWGAQP